MLACSTDEVRNIACEMIGMTLITHQVGPEGKQANPAEMAQVLLKIYKP